MGGHYPSASLSKRFCLSLRNGRQTEKGDFQTVDDLMKVQGLEAGKIDAQKARVVF
jgi:hypothetical protein